MMTLLEYILMLALSCCLNGLNEKQLDTLRTIEYVYRDVLPDETAETGIDYVITEIITFLNDDGSTSTKETVFEIPVLSDALYRDWKAAINLIAKSRGVDIKEFVGNIAKGVIEQGALDAFRDVLDGRGFVSDVDSFDYLDEREINEQVLRNVHRYVSFGIFYMSASMMLSLFSFWTSSKKKGQGL